jgi:hypothetical protein
MLLIPQIVPSLILGVPLGVRLVRHVHPDTFRRLCMSLNAWIVAFALAGSMRTLHLGGATAGNVEFGAVILLDVCLLYRFFSKRDTEPALAEDYSRSTTTAMP